VPPGLQRNILFIVKKDPLTGPWILSASRAYREHEGTWRHEGPSNGEIAYL
jgi:hypothetical protein